jgi:Protein of unknown function (DUF3563)
MDQVIKEQPPSTDHERLIFGSVSASMLHAIDEPRCFHHRKTTRSQRPSARRRRQDDALAAPRHITHEIRENFMFAYILEKLGDWFERSEQRRLDDYLAGAVDLAEVERRLRWLEKNGYPR